MTTEIRDENEKIIDELIDEDIVVLVAKKIKMKMIKRALKSLNKFY